MREKVIKPSAARQVAWEPVIDTGNSSIMPFPLGQENYDDRWKEKPDSEKATTRQAVNEAAAGLTDAAGK